MARNNGTKPFDSSATITYIHQGKRGGLPPTGDDELEARVAKLEASVGYIEREITDLKTEVRGLRNEARTDFRLLFGALIAVALGLAGLLAKGFGWL